MSFRRPAWLRPAVLALAALLLAACAPGTAAGSDGRAGTDERLAVAASFYPLQFVAQRVGGAHVRVRSLTKPGVERLGRVAVLLLAVALCVVQVPRG